MVKHSRSCWSRIQGRLNGEVAVDLASLNALMTRALVGHSNVRALQVSIDADGGLRQKGTVSKGIPVPFDVKASVSPAPDGRILIHAESTKGFGIPVSPLLKALHVQMDDLFKVVPDGGVTVEGNDVLLDPSRLLPPPAMRGRVTAVRVEKDPGDPFDFSVGRWNEQLVAGYSKITPQRGLKAHMPDYNDLPRHPPQAR